MLSHAKISDRPFDQKFFRPPEVGVSRWHGHTYRQTIGHGDSMTESAQLADSVKATDSVSMFILEEGAGGVFVEEKNPK